MEYWAHIDEFPTHLVSTHGRVKKVDTGRIFRPGRSLSTVGFALQHGTTTAGIHLEEVIS